VRVFDPVLFRVDRLTDVATARADARAILGLQAAIDRARVMIEAGADVTFVEAPTSAEELARITEALSVLQVANVMFGGLTPELGQQKFAGVLYPNAALQKALKAPSWHRPGPSLSVGSFELTDLLAQ
jgi:2-methylisocitrate lyase-like PEP mutase family enzyme